MYAYVTHAAFDDMLLVLRYGGDTHKRKKRKSDAARSVYRCMHTCCYRLHYVWSYAV
jgi:hypothetical protein